MRDFGGPTDRDASDRKLDAYADCFHHHGYSRWLVEVTTGQQNHAEFIGYAGVVAHPDSGHPLGSHDEIGWRLNRGAWRNGYATEAALAGLTDVFSRVGLVEVL